MSARALQVTYLANLLRSCGNSGDLSAGRRIHQRVLDLQREHGQDVFLLNLVIDMYGKCGGLREARAVFDAIQHPNVFTFNILIASYASAGLVEEAWKIFHAMPGRNAVSWNTMVSANAREGDFVRAKSLLARIPHHSLVSWNAMIGGYAREGNYVEAKRLFDGAKERDVVIWNALIHAKAALVGGGRIEEVEFLFSRIPCWDVISWNEMLAAHIKHGSLDRAKGFFDTRMLQRDVFSWNTMAAAFARMDHDTGAAGKRIFERMPQHNTVSWNSIVQGLSENGRFDDAKSLFESMGDRDSVSMIQMAVTYAQNGHPEQAQELFSRISPRTVAVWNALLWSYARNGHLPETLATFHRIPMMNRITCTVIIEAYGRSSRLEAAETLFFEKLPERDMVSCIAMMVAYSHNGRLDGALAVFEQIQHYPDVMVWTAMVASYVHNGELEMATRIFREIALQGLRPDAITFVTILTGCSHLGLVSRARDHFGSMEPAFGMRPGVEHYCCMVDALGRAKHLEEAEDLVRTMPFLPDAVAWNTLLGACRIHGDIKRGERVAKMVAELDERNQRPYVLLSNLYTSGDDPDEELEFLAAMTS